MSPVVAEKVRVGDRYVRLDGAKITITEVGDGWIKYSMLDESSKTPYGMSINLPVPETWSKAGSGPVPPEQKVWCVNHPLREAEPGQLYCPDCIDQVAEAWSKFAPEEAEQMTAMLLDDQKDHGKGDRGYD